MIYGYWMKEQDYNGLQKANSIYFILYHGDYKNTIFYLYYSNIIEYLICF